MAHALFDVVGVDEQRGVGSERRDLGGERVVAVIGDGAMSAGLAYEAMNNAGDSASRQSRANSRG